MKITGRLRIGEKSGVCVKSGDCVAIPTGGVVPDGANAVVMIEDVEVLNDEIAVYRPVKPWENVIRCGEELDKGSIVMNRGSIITPVAAGALAGLGIWRVDVFDGIKISVISTGDELVDVSSDASDGKSATSTRLFCPRQSKKTVLTLSLPRARKTTKTKSETQ